MSWVGRRVLRAALLVLPLMAAAGVSLLIAVACQLVGASFHREIARAQPRLRDAGVDASWRIAPDGAIVAAPGDTDFVCLQPEATIPRRSGCANSSAYPACLWQLPEPSAAGDLYRIWRNTTPEHRWGRPALVSLLLAVAAEYAQRWPGEVVTIGDLDAPGPRHRTHNRGHDVDIYLVDAMLARNEGAGHFPDNYPDRDPAEVELLRARVMDLARIIAVCGRGDIRIYYNDDAIVAPFVAWFAERGLHSSVGAPMQPHNDLHRFHFHLTIADRLQPLRSDRQSEEE